ncbi:hypothetical protein [Spongorhabdus nitratireducens]
MSSTKKKLKKLAKKGKYYKKANRQRLSLSAETKDVKIKLKVELTRVGKNAGASAVRELMAPLNPLLDWLSEGLEQQGTPQQEQSVVRTATPPRKNPAEVVSMARFPYKSPPCKACPAKSGGLCKCAQKKAKRRA